VFRVRARLRVCGSVCVSVSVSVGGGGGGGLADENAIDGRCCTSKWARWIAPDLDLLFGCARFALFAFAADVDAIAIGEWTWSCADNCAGVDAECALVAGECAPRYGASLLAAALRARNGTQRNGCNHPLRCSVLAYPWRLCVQIRACLSVMADAAASGRPSSMG
jgi:hypothetical protein